MGDVTLSDTGMGARPGPGTESGIRTATVSVVIPTFNCAAYIGAAIESALGQTHRPHEILVVDDGSTDGTEAVVATFGTRVRYLRQANGGVAAARNTGLREASGDAIAFLDADDFWEPDKLAVQLAVFAACPDVDLVCADFSLVSERGEERQRSYVKGKYRVFRSYGLDWPDIFPARLELADGACVYHGRPLPSLFLGNFVNTSSVLLRRRAVERAGEFSATLRTQEDYEYWLRVAAGGGVAYVDRPLLAFRRREGQLTAADQYVRLTEDMLTVVLAMAPAARGVMTTARISDRICERAVAVAKARLVAGDASGARRALRTAFAHRAFSPLPAVVWAWSWLPARVADNVRRSVRGRR